MKIPQSVFDGFDAKFTHAAAAADGWVWLYTAAPVLDLAEVDDDWINTGGDARRANCNMHEQHDGYVWPAGWWKYSAIERESLQSVPHILQQVGYPVPPPPVPQVPVALPQSVFNGAPDWVKWAFYEHAGNSVYWCATENKLGETQRVPGQPVPPIASWEQFAVTKRLQVPQTAQRQYGLPDPTVVTTKRITLELSEGQCEALLTESILRHFPQMAGGKLSFELTDSICVITAEVPL
jgi:hypothetical protein